jgi:cytochrome c oxidase subunit 2
VRKPDRTNERVRAVAFATLAALTLAGCGSDHSIMNGHTDEADRIASIGWLMLAIAGAVFVVVVGLLAVGLLRRPNQPHHGVLALRSDRRWIVGGGVALPSAVILLLSVMTVWVLADDDHDATQHITVIGHQYWWEVRYDGTDAVTANEFHIPVGEDVTLTLEAADVVHSLWVPELGPKRDLIPGRVNELTWRAETTGRFRGQCAEYCGLQHANMALYVVVEPREDFDRWLATQESDAAVPTTDEQRAGLDAFVDQPCGSCHEIRGTEARGSEARGSEAKVDLGPDLTHLASRETIGAGVAPFDRGHLGGWISDSQSLKPGNLMPPVTLSPQELQSLLAYLESLR